MTDRKKIIDLIRKQLAQSKSAEELGSIHEAEAFADIAQRLILKHKIELSDLENTQNETADPMACEYFNVAESLDIWRHSDAHKTNPPLRSRPRALFFRGREGRAPSLTRG